MKKLINSPEDVVSEALRGMEAAHADLVRVNHDPKYLVRADAPVKGKTAIISGGGSGASSTTPSCGFSTMTSSARVAARRSRRSPAAARS